MVSGEEERRNRGAWGGPAMIVRYTRAAMSGHSKWSQIKRQKGVNDVKRGAAFTKVAREIAMAARAGGGDPDGNFRLRLAMEKARAVNMPADNIKRAIERATGAGETEQFEEIVYEGYGPGGVAVLVEAATDNRNRTAAEVRSRFAKSGGALAASGAVAWQFEARGLITVQRDGVDPDEVALAAIDAGAEDVDSEADPIEIYTAPAELEGVRRAPRGRPAIAVERGRVGDDRQADRRARAPAGPARRCASSRSSRSSTTSSGSPPTSTSPRRSSPRSPGDQRIAQGGCVIVLGIDPGTAVARLRRRRADRWRGCARSTTAA